MKPFSSFSRRAFAILLVAAGLAACDGPAEPSSQPTLQMVAGSYRAAHGYGAITLTTTQNGETTDWLAKGASITIDLRGDGTTAGRVFIPGAYEDGSDFDADLAGTWTLAGGKVRLSHSADTFLRDMDLIFRTDRLEGEQTFSGVRVRVVLARG